MQLVLFGLGIDRRLQVVLAFGTLLVSASSSVIFEVHQGLFFDSHGELVDSLLKLPQVEIFYPDIAVKLHPAEEGQLVD